MKYAEHILNLNPYSQCLPSVNEEFNSEKQKNNGVHPHKRVSVIPGLSHTLSGLLCTGLLWGGAPHRQSVVTGSSGGKSGAAQKGEQWGCVTGVATDSQQPGSSFSLRTHTHMVGVCACVLYKENKKTKKTGEKNITPAPLQRPPLS